MSVDSSKNKYSSFLKFSGLAIQMIGIIGIFAWIGNKLDVYFLNEKAYYTLLLLLIGTMGSIYSVIKQLKF